MGRKQIVNLLVELFSLGEGGSSDLFIKRRTHSAWFWSLAIALSTMLLTAPIIWRLTRPGGPSDLITHANMASSMVKSGGWISYSIYYPIIHLASLGNHDEKLTRFAIVFVISLLVSIKALVIFHVVRFFAGTLGFALAITAIATIGTALMNPANPGDIYLGQFAPTVWHNSTTILAEPLVILSFAAFMWLFKSLNFQASYMFAILIFLCALAKPSFAIAFLPVAGVALLIRLIQDKSNTWFPLLSISFLPVTGLLAYQYYATFTSELVAWHTGIVPFVTWMKFSENLPLSFFLSFGPALLAVACFPKFFKQSPELLISWLATALAFTQLLLLAEVYSDGTLSFDGNFFWGIYQCLLIVYLVTMGLIIKVSLADTTPLDRKVGLSVAAIGFVGHGVTGLYYAFYLMSLK